MNAPKGHALISLDDLKRLLSDPEQQSKERNLHFRFLMNGRVLREFRTHNSGGVMMFTPVDLTWLAVELAHVLEQKNFCIQDLRVEITHES